MERATEYSEHLTSACWEHARQLERELAQAYERAAKKCENVETDAVGTYADGFNAGVKICTYVIRALNSKSGNS